MANVPCPNCGAAADVIPGIPGALCPACGEAILVADLSADPISAAAARFDQRLAMPGAGVRYKGAEGFRWTSATDELRLDICPGRELRPNKRGGTLLLTDEHLFFIDEAGRRESIQMIPVKVILGVRVVRKRNFLSPFRHLELDTSRGGFCYLVGRDAGNSFCRLISLLRSEDS